MTAPCVLAAVNASFQNTQKTFARFGRDCYTQKMTSNPASTPDAEIEITPGLVQSLLQQQHPDLAHLPVRIMESGWDNVMVRIGEDLALRLPRRAVANALILNEQKWLPFLGPQLSVPIPVPLRVGGPQEDYPFHWSVLPWLAGQAADQSPPAPSQAIIVSEFLRELHAVDLPDEHPKNPSRDCGLFDKREDIARRMIALKGRTDLLTLTIMDIWNNALDTDIDTPKCWIAGDMHARNVLVDDGVITAFIDWGDMCGGDRATDLSAIWALFNCPSARHQAIKTYGMSEATLKRAKGWAVFYGVILLQTGLVDTPRHAQMGRQILQRLNADGV